MDQGQDSKLHNQTGEKNRSLVDVLARIIEVIPANELPFVTMRELFKSIQREAIYAAPEIQHECWRRAQWIVDRHLARVHHSIEWREKALDIWMDLEEDWPTDKKDQSD